MDGRGAGTPGADRAAAYLVAEFRRLGLRPAGDAGGYLQRFEVLTGVRLAPGAAIEVAAPGAPLRTFAGGSDFLPFTFSADGDVTGDVAFAGYGITAAPLGYDDYAGLDVRGKVVVVMTGEPRETDPAGPFRPAEHFHYTELRHKVLNAREHGAAAVVVVENPGRGDRLAALRGTTPSWGIVALSARREIADAVLGPGGLDLATLRAQIDRTGAPVSRVLPGVRARVRSALLRDRGATANVVGILPGTDSTLAAEAVVLGAHYDHLGRGSPFSLAPERGDAIHPGADDNASGTAALLGIAETLTRSGAPRRSVVVVAFSGEELGLLGSTHYVGQPAVPLDRTVAMVNLDSVGRLRDGRLHVMGVDTGQGLRALVEQAGQGVPALMVLRGDGVGPSDHTAFLNRERPVAVPLHGSPRRLPPPERHLGQDRRRRAADGHDGRVPGRSRPGRSRRLGRRSSACPEARRAPAPAPPATDPTSGRSPTSATRLTPASVWAASAQTVPRTGRGSGPATSSCASPESPSGRSTTSCSPSGAGVRATPSRSATSATGPSGPCRPRSRSGDDRRGRGADGRRVLSPTLDRRAMLGLGLAGAAAVLREHVTARWARAQPGGAAPPGDPRERHLAGLRQLTFGGQNAEAYWDRSGDPAGLSVDPAPLRL